MIYYVFPLLLLKTITSQRYQWTTLSPMRNTRWFWTSIVVQKWVPTLCLPYHSDYWTQLLTSPFFFFEIWGNLQESAGIWRNPRKSEGISRNQRESAGIGKESAGIRGNHKESAGISRNKQKWKGILKIIGFESTKDLFSFLFVLI